MLKQGAHLRFWNLTGVLATLLLSAFAASTLAAGQSKLSPKQAAAKLQHEIGEEYEFNGRLSEAEAAYLKAITDGNDDTRRTALWSLRRVIEKRSTGGAR